MRSKLPLLFLLITAACAAPPPPVAAPSTPPPPPSPVAEDRVVETVTVNASALNVRETPTTDAAVVRQVKRGTALSVLGAEKGWLRVRLASGDTGWVAERFVLRPGESAAKSAARRSGNCPADSDYAFLETPQLSFSENPPPGMVVVEANVSATGAVTSTKVISNTTGQEALGFLTEREIRTAKFAPPIRNCVPRAFIFTYKRTF